MRTTLHAAAAIAALSLLSAPSNSQIPAPALFSPHDTIGAGGGFQTMHIAAGPDYAYSVYAIVGTLSGTSPGLSIGGVSIPINIDACTMYTLVSTNPQLGGSVGALDATGRAFKRFRLTAQEASLFAGATFAHAALLFDPGTGALEAATNALSVTVMPY